VVHLVAAGVDVTVIRSWLGHVSLDTTNHYAQANLETKRKALERQTNSRDGGATTASLSGSTRCSLKQK
jgi:site-specific recombinase XerD